jgi:hypothetical protein
VAAFNGNPDVAFGDINLSEQQIRGNHNPGAGGWPTIRYFNKETGLEGAPYEKKTDKSMCDELGDDAYMTEYITSVGKTGLCSTDTLKGCNEKEVAYINKMKESSADDIEKQLVRLQGMDAKSMKADLAGIVYIYIYFPIRYIFFHFFFFFRDITSYL